MDMLKLEDVGLGGVGEPDRSSIGKDGKLDSVVAEKPLFPLRALRILRRDEALEIMSEMLEEKVKWVSEVQDCHFSVQAVLSSQYHLFFVEFCKSCEGFC